MMENQEKSRMKYILNQWLLKFSLGCLFFGFLAANPAHAIPAFPGAEGFGANATGGRGGKVIFVTNLNDSGPGSFRHAVEEETGKRIVIFRVGGTIELSKRIKINSPDITIAGQTAPFPVTLKNAGLKIGASNVIVRGMRLRAGDITGGQEAEDRDSLSIVGDGIENVIIDHCSISWGVDETASTWYDVSNITFQWNIISEGLQNSLHPKGAHSTGLLAGDNADNISIINNYFAHNYRRNPLLSSLLHAEVVNNVIYNWGKHSIQVQDYNEKGNTTQANIINNYYKPGRSTEYQRALLLWLLPSSSQVFYSGNRYETSSGLVDPITQPELMDVDNPAILTNSRTFADSVHTIRSAEAAKALVLAQAGAMWPRRDAIDQRVVGDFFSGTGEIIDSPSEVGGWISGFQLTGPTDSDNDGMPDSWEQQHGLNPQSAVDGNGDLDGDGYTNIEEFINFSDPKTNSIGTNPLLNMTEITLNE